MTRKQRPERPGRSTQENSDQNNPVQKPQKPRNFVLYPFLLALSVIIFLFGIREVGELSFFGLKTKKADILSDILIKDLSEQPENLFLATDDNLSAYQIDTLTTDSIRTDTSSIVKDIAVTRGKIEDYAPDNQTIALLHEAIKSHSDKPVRIAFIGDSFIEGDLLTGDIRELLQDSLGGNGVGFVPVASPVSKFRQTVLHNFQGWKNYSIKDRNKDDIDSKFILSGSIFKPDGNDAEISYTATLAKRHLKGVNNSSFYFINEKNTTIEALINDTLSLSFIPESSPLIQRIQLSGVGSQHSISFRFSNTDGFFAYGVTLDGTKGIAVDNFSDRGNSGIPFAKLTSSMNRKFDNYAHYDLIVLQYGLNVVSEGVYNYKGYQQQMVSIINKIKSCYPNAGILIMGVSDRSTKIESEYRTMPEIKSMINFQRNMAKTCSVAFWDTYTAMGGENSMPVFVTKGWAAKDYTHLSASGGKIIARKFVHSLFEALNLYGSNIQSEEPQTTPLPVHDFNHTVNSHE